MGNELMTTTATAVATERPTYQGKKRVGMREALDSEWAKIITVRSTYWSGLATVIGGVAISVLLSWAITSNLSTLSPEDRAKIDVSSTMSGLQIAMLIIGVLGVLVITSEYSSGMIRTSLTALPRRGMLLSAKALVLAAVSLACGLLVTWGSYLGSLPIFHSKNISFDLGASGNLRAVLGSAVAVMLISLLGFAIGVLLRHTAGSITALVVLFFIGPIITNFLPGTWGNDINKLMPSNAAQAMYTTYKGNVYLTPLNGLLVLLAWIAILLGGAFFLFKKRDA
jgi:ABC-2 type transport system permease protein